MTTNPSTETSAEMPPEANPEVIEAMLDQAAAALEQGRIDQARTGFLEVLRLDPRQFDALHLLGVIAMQQRDFPRCIELISQAIAVDAGEAMAHSNLGVAWMESQQPEKALACFDQAIALEPDEAQAHFGRGVALLALEQWPGAIASFGQNLALQPGNAEAHFNRGNAFLAMQRFADAISSYDQALALQPRHVAALINRGHACYALERHNEALANHNQAIALQPDRPTAFTGRGNAYLAMQRFEEAIASYDQALALQPDQPEVLGNRANALVKLRRMAEAISGYEQALKLNPDHATVRSNFGGALRDAGRWQDGLAQCERALEIDPHHAGAHMNRGNVLLDMGHLGPARDAFAKVNALQPDNAESQWAQGWADLLAGDWERGLPQLEWRWKKPGLITSPPRAFVQPLWLGEQDLRGRTILLHAEQGLGDTLHFCRYVPMVVALGARVLLEVQPALKKLVGTLHGEAQVLARGQDPLPAFDFHCPLMSLPLAFKTTVESVPASTPYLRADAQLIQTWGERLGEKKQPRIGLVWSGNSAHRNDHHRSMPLATVLSALPQGVQLFCLQKDIRPSDAALLNAPGGVVHLPEALQTFDATAALIEHMDLVISVDTSVAHLAGALGKPTWILLSRMPDWRWLLDRQDSPWYSSARLFRQTVWGQWSDPLGELGQALGDELPRWR
ncbi:MAG: tetratricopeptide repeat protein [Burkholderiales bacterium]|nr:tetratricopeptide repeat protein [Burkholderiales bacterium]